MVANPPIHRRIIYKWGMFQCRIRLPKGMYINRLEIRMTLPVLSSFDVVWFYKLSKTTGEWFRFVLVQKDVSIKQQLVGLFIQQTSETGWMAWRFPSEEKAASAKGAIATTTARRDDWNDVPGWSESVVHDWMVLDVLVMVSAYCGKNLWNYWDDIVGDSRKVDARMRSFPYVAIFPRVRWSNIPILEETHTCMQGTTPNWVWYLVSNHHEQSI